MQKISLDVAVSEIIQACPKKGEKSPFFFIVGAGISSPIIPLAIDIEKECREIAIKKHRTKEPIKNTPYESYSHWFQQAFPQPKERQEYLKNKIRDKPITLANLRLAHLLSERKISNLVVTPNFDDMLSRALWLFQIQHIVCDHPQTIGRINPDIKDIQIIHVHGSYLFYDCCNTNLEINNRTNKKNVNPIKDFIDNLLISRVPLVIGYGGWEEDAIMKALKKRLSNTTSLPYNLYWFCFKEDEINQLPSWLKNHNNVKFVIPSKITPTIESRSRLNLEVILIDEHNKKEKKPELTSVNVLETFLISFGYITPPLIKDPLAFFIQHIKKSWPKKTQWTEMQAMPEDLYFIDNVIEKIERANKLLKNNLNEESQKSQKKLDQIINLVRNFRYFEAFNKSNLIDERSLDTYKKVQFSKALFTISMNLKSHPIETIKGYDKVIHIINKLNHTTRKKNFLSRELVYSLLFKGYELQDQGNNRSAIKVYNEIIKKFENTSNDEIRSCVVDALYHKVDALIEIDEIELAIEINRQIIDNYGDDKNIKTREIIGLSLIESGRQYSELNLEDHALRCFDELINRYGRTARTSFLSELVITALFEKGNTLMRYNRNKEAFFAYSKALIRIEKINNPEFLYQLLKIAISKAMALSDIDQHLEAIKTLDNILEKYSKISKPEIRSLILDALLIRGTILMKMGKQKEAIKTFNEVIKKFSRSKDPDIRENLNIARQKLDCLKNCPYR